MDEAELADVRNRRIGFVFQQFNLLPSLTAWRNVELPLVLCRASIAPSGSERAVEALTRVGLGRPGRPPAGRAVRRPAAAGLGRPGPRHRPRPHPRRRADRATSTRISTPTCSASSRSCTSRAGRSCSSPTSTTSPRRPERVVHIRDGQLIRGARLRRGARRRAVSWSETVRTAYEAIRTRRLRSVLTMLGILIGIAAVMLTVGSRAGRAGEGGRPDQPARLKPPHRLPGQHDVVVGRTRRTGQRDHPDVRRRCDARQPGRRSRHRGRRAGRRPRASPWRSAPPTGRRMSSARRRTGFRSGRGPSPRAGSSPSRTWTAAASSPSSGRRRRASCSASGTRSVRAVTVNGQVFTVVGVLATAGSSSTGDEDDQAVVPRTTFATRVSTSTNSRSVSTIYLEAKDQQSLSAAYQEVDERAAEQPRRHPRGPGLHGQQPAVPGRHRNEHRAHPHRPARRASRGSRCSSAASAS